MSTDSLGDRMKKNYEDRYRIYLTRRTPVILRLDGKGFSKLTKGCKRPFDTDFHTCMFCTTMVLCYEIQGAKFAYQQSDEISILITDFDNINTDAWFNYNLQKMVSSWMSNIFMNSACFSTSIGLKVYMMIYL